MMTNRMVMTAVAGIAAAFVLSACGTRHVSRGIDAEGQAEDVVFPDPTGIVLKEGTFPNIESLRAVGPGVTKDQLYHLLGRPHFREGLLGVREWDYLFHFRTADGIVSCQYKVIFDRQYRGQSFHWSPATCAGRLAQPDAVQDVRQERYELAADALFAFDRHQAADILPEGRREIARIAAALRDMPAATVQVIGHTDRLGSDAYNQGLSQQRALTVRQQLVEAGIPASAVVAVGAGSQKPVKHCDEQLSRDALVACLQPNRRVEILASAR